MEIFLRWKFVDIEILKDELTESRNIANLNVHKNKYDIFFYINESYRAICFS